MDVVASLDSAVQQHLQSVTVFEGRFETVVKELFGCLLSVLREHITEEISSAVFVLQTLLECNSFCCSLMTVNE